MNKPLSLLTFAVLALSFWSCNLEDFQESEEVEGIEATEPDIAEVRVIRNMYNHALTKGECYELLRHLCLNIGTRLSGSEGAEKAVAWTKSVMEDYNFDTVYLQEVKVPHWERGLPETVRMIATGDQVKLSALAIGGSVPTPKVGVTAAVVMVESLEEVEALGEKGIKGKIVFYNRAVDQRIINTGGGYGSAVDQRVRGASQAAKYGAVGVAVRSVTTAYDDAPHTGTLVYEDGVKKIPAVALGYKSSDMLEKALQVDPKTELQLIVNSRWLPDATSYNVVGELRGSELPEEIITVGGHLDSWDVGHGAHDDGAGCMHAIGALRLFQELGIKPKRTLRAVMFMNEENGSRGGIKYASEAVKKGENHLFAIESDAGGFSPRGFGVTAAPGVVAYMQPWVDYFPPQTLHFISEGGGGADIKHLNKELGTPMAGFIPDMQKTFDYHHSENDVFETVNRRELELGTATIAGFIYLLDKNGVHAIE